MVIFVTTCLSFGFDEFCFLFRDFTKFFYIGQLHLWQMTKIWTDLRESSRGHFFRLLVFLFYSIISVQTLSLPQSATILLFQCFFPLNLICSFLSNLFNNLFDQVLVFTFELFEPCLFHVIGLQCSLFYLSPCCISNHKLIRYLDLLAWLKGIYYSEASENVCQLYVFFVLHMLSGFFLIVLQVLLWKCLQCLG